MSVHFPVPFSFKTNTDLPTKPYQLSFELNLHWKHKWSLYGKTKFRLGKKKSAHSWYMRISSSMFYVSSVYKETFCNSSYGESIFFRQHIWKTEISMDVIRMVCTQNLLRLTGSSDRKMAWPSNLLFVTTVVILCDFLLHGNGWNQNKQSWSFSALRIK